MPDSKGCKNAEVDAASLSLVRGPGNESSRYQDSQACDDSALSFGVGGSAHEVGQFSAGNEEEALVEMKEGSKIVLNLSSPVSVPGDDDGYVYSIPRQKRRRKKKKSKRNMPVRIRRTLLFQADPDMISKFGNSAFSLAKPINQLARFSQFIRRLSVELRRKAR